MSRWFYFFLAIVFGIALGLLYGWVVNPVRYVDTSPDTLSRDYKSDYVLMVAEAYKAEGDLAAALRRLALLGNSPPDLLQVKGDVGVFGGSGVARTRRGLESTLFNATIVLAAVFLLVSFLSALFS